MVGSERLTQLRFGDDGNGHDIGVEFAAALPVRTTTSVSHMSAPTRSCTTTTVS